jgi:DUF1365 family protein
MNDFASHAIYEGTVMHRRLTPLRHQFRYRINFVYLNLDQLSEAFRGRWLWSCDRPSVAWFRRADHLGTPSTSLADATRELLRQHGIECAGPICLLTQLRCLGFIMNPVSFYFCYAADRQELRAVVAEVNNTPWGERHCYVLEAGGSPRLRARIDKRFHVSPFMPMDQQYHWRLSPPGESLRVGISNFRHGEHQFSAALNLRRREWNARELRRALWRHPLMPQRIYAGIYWQALKLWWRGAPYYQHPGSHPESAGRTQNIEEEHVECGNLD